jgi:hypothetical protein
VRRSSGLLPVPLASISLVVLYGVETFPPILVSPATWCVVTHRSLEVHAYHVLWWGTGVAVPLPLLAPRGMQRQARGEGS